MKITIEIEDALLIKAKQRAADLRQPLRELVEQGLRQQLQRPAHRASAREAIRWVTVPGGVPPEIEFAVRPGIRNPLIAPGRLSCALGEVAPPQR